MATIDKAQLQAEEPEIDEADSEEFKGKVFLKTWFSMKFAAIALAAMVALGSTGGGVYYLLSRSEAAPAGKIKPPVFFDMPDVLVNLSSNGTERTQYLKVKVVLELPDEGDEGGRSNRFCRG